MQLLRGIRKITHNITVVVSMADDGASAGRLRRLFSVPPPGDLINCLAALSNAEPLLKELLTFRFKGERWGRDDSIGGHKLGNLIMVALTQITGDFSEALEQMQRIFRSHGVILPATKENVSIWAKTVEGKIIKGEEKIDLGKYSGKREISEVHLEPSKCTSPLEVKQAIGDADVIIAGPGDLYTTILPVLLVKDIQEGLKKSRAKKVFVVNVANKPFETPNYHVRDYLEAIVKHLGSFPFEMTLVNNNQKYTLPEKLHYSYVAFADKELKDYNTRVVVRDVVSKAFPLYHDPDKITRAFIQLI